MSDCVSSNDTHLLTRQRLDHLLPKVIHSLHLSGLQRQLADLGARATGRPVHLHLDHLALDDLRLLLDAHANRPPERLRQRLRLRHLEREDLAAGDARERRVRAERLRHAHRDRRLRIENSE